MSECIHQRARKLCYLLKRVVYRKEEEGGKEDRTLKNTAVDRKSMRVGSISYGHCLLERKLEIGKHSEGGKLKERSLDVKKLLCCDIGFPKIS